MVENRPDWCISRQRAWGVSIAAFTCKECGRLLLNKAIIDHVANQLSNRRARMSGSRGPPSELLPSGTVCKQVRNKIILRRKWTSSMYGFDSGVSHAAVLKQRPELSWPADLYLEGSDQHRGWFQSSLLTSVGTTGAAPYRTVLTHDLPLTARARR